MFAIIFLYVNIWLCGVIMIISTLKEYVDKAGSQNKASKLLGVTRQQISMTICRNTPVYVEHDENLNPISCFLKKEWGKFKTT
jgi:hypothetical protein